MAEEGVEVVGGPPVAPAARQLADDDAAAERPAALVVVLVDAVVADVRVREGDDLPGIGRIGDHLLVARQHGVEHDLAGRRTVDVGADPLALERGAVRQHQRGLPHGSGGRSQVNAGPRRRRTTGSPRSNVCRTRPVSLRPAYGVLRLRLASASGSTTHTASGSMTHRLAGRPSSNGPPWSPSTPATAAGRQQSRARISASGRSSSVMARARAVSRPSIPGGAWSNGCSLSSRAWGA